MIFTVTAIRRDTRIARTVGVFQVFESARRLVSSNDGDIYEGIYDYVVIQKYNFGLHPIPEESWWYKWNRKEEGYVTLKERPEKFKLYGNWGIR